MILMAETIWTPPPFWRNPYGLSPGDHLWKTSPPWAIEGIFKQQIHGKSMRKSWEIHGKTMGNPWKPMENHDDMDISLSELSTNPAVVNHIWGTSTFQQPKWRAILCNVLTQFPRNKMSLNHSKRPTIYAKMKRPEMDTEWYRTNWTNQ